MGAARQQIGTQCCDIFIPVNIGAVNQQRNLCKTIISAIRVHNIIMANHHLAKNVHIIVKFH